ncbi:dihydrofolate reductase family protein [Phaeacidiphilus oryzae]|jgi:dihydrofolate reductase|uniref:dihydrofolate reductase family protein n=1 Tax=Phaeacidiphilus oryzae TaxID=348818 RepID=UPI00055B4FCB|nr:dihydrofolate reductase family protein [Phaeacidiphilus oryzae]
MASLQYQCAMSLDGFIAGPGGDMSWLAGYLAPDPAAAELTRQTGALLVGRRTFSGDDPYRGTENEGEPYGGGWDGPQFVVTHTVPAAAPRPGITFVTDLDTAIGAAKAAAGESDVGVLGARIAAQCIAKDQLDEIFVSIVPVLLGDGVRLFERPGGAGPVPLERVALTESPTATSLRFRVLRG